MKRATLILAAVLAAALAGTPAALADTQTAASHGVTATFTFHGTPPSFSGQRLMIARGQVLYDQPVISKFCQQQCSPFRVSGGRSSVHVVDLEHDGQPDVVLDLFSGGAHCCSIEQIFSFDPGTSTYAKTEHNFGDPGEKIVDLGHDGRYEFLTGDDRFAYTFTDYASSGLPIEILTFSGRRFQNVTRSFPKLIARDAALWLRLFKRMSRQHYQDSVGVIAAWAADEDLLGHSRRVARYLSREAKAGHLNTTEGSSGHTFVIKLTRFLRRHGYLRRP